MTPTDNMTISYFMDTGAGYQIIADCGVDHFLVFEGEPTSIIEQSENINLKAYPNPSNSDFNIVYELLNNIEMDKFKSSTVWDNW